MMFNRFQRGGRGMRKKPGTMNKLEAAYADVLANMKGAGNILWYKFEGITLKLAPDLRYTADFAVMTADGTIELHDVKGTSGGKPWCEGDAKVKIKAAAEMFPFVFKLVWRHQGSWYRETVGNEVLGDAFTPAVFPGATPGKIANVSAPRVTQPV